MKETIIGILGLIWLVGIPITFIVLTLGLRYKKISFDLFSPTLISVAFFSYFWPVGLVIEILRWIDKKYKKFVRHPDK